MFSTANADESFFFSFRIKPVADPRLGLDVLGRARVLLELFSDVGDEDAQIFRLFRAVAAPDCGENGAMGKNFPAIREKILNHVVLFGREMDGLAIDFNQALLGIDFEISGFIGNIGLRRRAERRSKARTRAVVPPCRMAWKRSRRPQDQTL